MCSYFRFAPELIANGNWILLQALGAGVGISAGAIGRSFDDPGIQFKEGTVVMLPKL